MPATDPHATTSPHSDVALVAGAMLALGALLLGSSMYTAQIAPAALALFGIPWEVRAACSALGFFAIAAASYFDARSVAGRRKVVAAAVAALAAAALVSLAIALGGSAEAGGIPASAGPAPAILCLAGIALFGVVFAWLNFLFACLLTRLPSLRAAAIAVIGGVILRQFALPLYSNLPGPVVTACGTGVLFVLLDVCLARAGQPTLDAMGAEGAIAQLELTNPFSSLLPPHRLFVCVFLFSLSYNFANFLGVPALSVRRYAVVVALLALLYLLLVLREHQEDRLFSLAVLFVMAGLLCAPLLLGRDTFIAHTCLFLGASCFSILLWMVMYGLGQRSPAALGPVFGVAFALDATGQFVGGALSSVASGLVASDAHYAQVIILMLALVFFSFVWIGFKGFSFTDAIRGVERVEAVVPTESDPSLDEGEHANAPAGTETEASLAPSADEGAASDLAQAAQTPLDLRCQELAHAAGLTPRETEIFELLAHGRNAAYIMDTLVVSRNTAKAHIKHIYTKLDVHSHQELLSLVEANR